MNVFADSSAVVKLYADEPGHEQVRSFERPLMVSALARVEVAGALWRKHRMGELSVEDVAVLVQAFEADWNASVVAAPGPFAVVGVVAGVVASASRLVARHPLRAYDAVQLASALAVRQALGDPVVFAAFDQQLLDAAAREGLSLAG